MGHLFSVLLHIISVILFCFIDSTLYLLFIPSFRWIYNLEDYLQVGDCSTESQNMFKTLWKKKVQGHPRYSWLCWKILCFISAPLISSLMEWNIQVIYIANHGSLKKEKLLVLSSFVLILKGGGLYMCIFLLILHC